MADTINYSQRDNSPTFQPVTMPVQEHLDRILREIDASQSVDELLRLVCAVNGLLGTQGKIVSRQTMVDVILPKIKEKTAVIASTWNGRSVYWFSVAGAVVSIIGSGLGAAGSTFVVWKTAGDAQQIYNRLQPWTAIQSTASAAGQGLETISRLIGNDHAAQRELVTAEKDRLMLKREQTKDAQGSMGHKGDEALRLMQELIEKLHRAKSTAVGG